MSPCGFAGRSPLNFVGTDLPARYDKHVARLMADAWCMPG